MKKILMLASFLFVFVLLGASNVSAQSCRYEVEISYQENICVKDRQGNETCTPGTFKTIKRTYNAGSAESAIQQAQNWCDDQIRLGKFVTASCGQAYTTDTRPECN